MTLDSVGLEAAAKVLAFRDLAADPDWHGVYEEEWAAQPEEYREAWRESVREVLAPYLAAVVPVTPTTENHDTVEWLRSTSREFASHGFRSCDVSLLDAERVARAERERGFVAGRAAATPDGWTPTSDAPDAPGWECELCGGKLDGPGEKCGSAQHGPAGSVVYGRAIEEGWAEKPETNT